MKTFLGSLETVFIKEQHPYVFLFCLYDRKIIEYYDLWLLFIVNNLVIEFTQHVEDPTERFSLELNKVIDISRCKRKRKCLFMYLGLCYCIVPAFLTAIET